MVACDCGRSDHAWLDLLFTLRQAGHEICLPLFDGDCEFDDRNQDSASQWSHYRRRHVCFSGHAFVRRLCGDSAFRARRYRCNSHHQQEATSISLQLCDSRDEYVFYFDSVEPRVWSTGKTRPQRVFTEVLLRDLLDGVCAVHWQHRPGCDRESIEDQRINLAHLANLLSLDFSNLFCGCVSGRDHRDAD